MLLTLQKSFTHTHTQIGIWRICSTRHRLACTGNHSTLSTFTLYIPITQLYTHTLIYTLKADTNLSCTRGVPSQSLCIHSVVILSLSQLKAPQSSALCLSRSLHLGISDIFPEKNTIISSSSRELSAGENKRAFTFARQWTSWNSYSLNLRIETTIKAKQPSKLITGLWLWLEGSILCL